MKVYTLNADVDFVERYSNRVKYELDIPEDEYNKFIKMSEDEQKEFFKEHGRIVITGYNIKELGDISNIQLVRGRNL